MPIRIIALVLLCLGLGQAAAARGLTAAERQSLPDAIAAFRQALEEQDVETVMAFAPPLVTAGLAEGMGMTVPDMIAAMADKTAATGGLVTVESIVLDADAAATAESADGEPYLLIPTEIVVVFPETGTVRQRSHTLAFPDAGRWLMLRLGDPERRMLLKRTYPQFAGAELPAGSAEVIR